MSTEPDEFVSTIATAHGLRGGTLAVLRAIAKFTDPFPCFAGEKTIAAWIGMSERNVQRHLTALKSRKIIHVNRRCRALGRGRDYNSLLIVGYNDDVSRAGANDDQPDKMSGWSRGVPTRQKRPTNKTKMTDQQDKSVTPIERPIGDLKETNTPKPPRLARGRSGRIEFSELIDAQRQPRTEAACDALISILAAVPRFDAGDPSVVIRELVDEIAELDDEGADEVRKRLVHGRHGVEARNRTVSPAEIRSAIKSERAPADARRRAIAASVEQVRRCAPAVAEAWNAARDDLRIRLGKEVVKQWLADVIALGIDTNGVLKLGASSKFYRDWVNANYIPEIETSIKTHLPAVRYVEIVVYTLDMDCKICEAAA